MFFIFYLTGDLQVADANQTDHIHRLISCLHMALPIVVVTTFLLFIFSHIHCCSILFLQPTQFFFLQRGASSSKFINFINDYIIPVFDQVIRQFSLNCWCANIGVFMFVWVYKVFVFFMHNLINSFSHILYICLEFVYLLLIQQKKVTKRLWWQQGLNFSHKFCFGSTYLCCRQRHLSRNSVAGSHRDTLCLLSVFNSLGSCGLELCQNCVQKDLSRLRFFSLICLIFR